MPSRDSIVVYHPDVLPPLTVEYVLIHKNCDIRFVIRFFLYKKHFSCSNRDAAKIVV